MLLRHMALYQRPGHGFALRPDAGPEEGPEELVGHHAVVTQPVADASPAASAFPGCR